MDKQPGENDKPTLIVKASCESSTDIPDWHKSQKIINGDNVKGGEAVHLPLTLET